MLLTYGTITQEREREGDRERDNNNDIRWLFIILLKRSTCSNRLF